jgi:hypothetical protein
LTNDLEPAILAPLQQNLMSIAPPRGPENERGLADSEARPTPEEAAASAPSSAPNEGTAAPAGAGGASGDDTAPFSVADGAALMDESVNSSDADALWARFRDEQIALYEAEAALDEVSNPKRSAWLLHEAARLREQRAQNVREAARLYTQSLSRDPTLQANTWALYRLFSSRQSWENVLRLLDAEARFAPLPTAADRADLMLEKGRILEDRLGRDTEAIAAYRHALALSPEHIGAHLALLLVGFEGNDDGVIDGALAGLASHVQSPELRALFTIELARRQRGPLGVEPGIFAVRVAKAATTLFESLGEGASEDLVCGELDRLSLLATAVRPSDPSDPVDLRGRVLDLLESHLADVDEAVDDPALLVAVHREKARFLVAGGKRDGALALLSRALERLPRHPLLLADLLDFADELGRPDAIAGLQHAGHLPPGERSDEAQVRRAEAAARSGAYGEAMGILSEFSAESPYAALASLVRVRVLARTGDVEGLVNAFVAEAKRLDPDGATGGNDGDVDVAAKTEAAHLLVRAAVLRGEALSDPRGAEALLRRALVALPGYSPAREALRNTLIAAGDVGALAALYEDEAARTSEPDRAANLMRAAYLLHRDLSRDEGALERLASHAPPINPVGAAVERLDVLGARAGEGPEARAALPEALAQLLTAIAAAPEGASVRTGELALLGARWIELLAIDLHTSGGGAVVSPELLAQACALGEVALATDPPVAGAGAFLERHHRAQGEVAAAVEVLVGELRQSVDRAQPEVQRALRFRLALTAAEARAWALAVAALSPLRRDHDRAAINWSLELARRSGDAALEAEVLEESTVRAQLVAGGDEAVFLHALALSQAEHESGKRVGRTRSPVLTKDDGALGGPVFASERALNRLRDVAAEPVGSNKRAPANREALVARYSQLADALAGTEIGGELRQDADLFTLAAGGRDTGGTHAAFSVSDNAFDAASTWISGVRAGDRQRTLTGLAGLAAQAEPTAASAMFAQLGLRHLLAGANADLSAAGDSLRRALAGGSAIAEVALSDFVIDDASDQVHAGMVARAERLARAEGDEGRGARTLSAALYADLALRDERQGNWAGAAANQARVVDLDPRSPAPWLALARVSEAAEDRRARASALLQIATRLRSNEAAASQFAAAAALLDEEGLSIEAGAAWTEVLRRRPNDESAFARCHALLRAQDDPTPLARLIDFKLAQVDDSAARIALYAERAALFRDDPERRDDVIADHRRILALDPKHLDSLRALAGLASEGGRPEVAVDLLTRALAVATEPDLQHQLRLDLIAAHVADKDGEAALAVLADAIAGPPDQTSRTLQALREQAVEIGLAEQKWDFVATQFEALRTLAETPEDQAAWIVRLGRLQRDQRRDIAAALDAFRAAVRLDPFGEAVRELVSTMGDVPLPPEDGPLVSDATRAIRHSLLPNPLLPRRLESLAMLARSGGLVDLADIAAQLHALLGGPPSRGRSRGLVRALSLSLIAPVPTPDDVSLRKTVEKTGDLWAQLAEPLARLHPWDATSFGVGRNTKVAPGSEPRLAWADAASTAFGITDLSLHIAGRDDLGVAAFDAPPTLVLGRGVAGGDATVRFRVGRVLALLAQKAALFDRIGLDELLLDWAAARFLFTEVVDSTLPGAAVKSQAKALGKVMTRKERKAIEPLVVALPAAAPGASEIIAYRNHVLTTANRAGLLVSGDLGMTLRVVSQQANPSPADLSTDEALDVIRFAFGDRFTEVRDEMRQRDRVNTGEHGAG